MSLPFTTGQVLTADDLNRLAVAATLASAGGANLIGYGSSTVKLALDALTSPVTSVNGHGPGAVTLTAADISGVALLNGDATQNFSVKNATGSHHAVSLGQADARYAPIGGGGGGSGTVTSVGLSLPAELTVSGSPVTASGTLSGAWASQTARKVFAAPSGSTGTPVFRTLTAADIPSTQNAVVSLESFGVVFGGGSPSGTTNGALINSAITSAIAGNYNLSCGAGVINLGGVGLVFPATMFQGFSFICHPDCAFLFSGTSGDCIKINSATSCTFEFGNLIGTAGSSVGLHMQPTAVGSTGETAIVVCKIGFNSIVNFAYSIYADCNAGNIAQNQINGVLANNGYGAAGLITGFAGGWGGLLIAGASGHIHQGNQYNINYILGTPTAVSGTSLPWIGINDGAVGPTNDPGGNNVNTYTYGAIDGISYANSYGINTTAAFNTFIGPVVDVNYGAQLYGNAKTNLFLISDFAAITAQINNLSTFGSAAYTWVMAPGGGSSSFIAAGTGAVTRTMQNKARDIVSILDFGADPSGAVDSYPAIQAAITAMPSEGGTLLFPAGTYLVNSVPNPGTKSINIDINTGCVFSGTGTGTFKFPYMTTNGGQMAVGPYIRSQTMQKSVTSGGGIAALNVEMLQPSGYGNGQSVAIYAGASTNNPTPGGNIWAINPLISVGAAVPAGSSCQNIECDINNSSANATVKGITISGISSQPPTMAIEILMNTTKWKRGIDIRDSTVGLWIYTDSSVNQGIILGNPGQIANTPISMQQMTNTGDCIVMQRLTSSGGYFLRGVNEFNSASMFSIDTGGNAIFQLATFQGFVTCNGSLGTIQLYLSGHATGAPAGVVNMGNEIFTSASAGGAAGLPGPPAGYLGMYLGSTLFKIPFFGN